MEVISFLFGSFWVWLGFIIVLTIFIKGFYLFYNRIFRHIAIMKHGYPPGCDADGEFKKEEDNSDTDD